MVVTVVIYAILVLFEYEEITQHLYVLNFIFVAIQNNRFRLCQEI